MKKIFEISMNDRFPEHGDEKSCISDIYGKIKMTGDVIGITLKDIPQEPEVKSVKLPWWVHKQSIFNLKDGVITECVVIEGIDNMNVKISPVFRTSSTPEIPEVLRVQDIGEKFFWDIGTVLQKQSLYKEINKEEM